MKKIITILILFILFLSFKGYNQAIYTGGEGGGYASLSVSPQTEIKTEKLIEQEFKVSVYPNPISPNKDINASSADFAIGKSMNLKIYDLLGNMIDNRNYYLSEQLISLNPPLQKMSKSMYLFVFTIDQKKTTVRVSMN